MSKPWRILLLIVGLGILSGAVAGARDNNRLPAVNNLTYMAHCGVCHTAYPPQLLPRRSWTRLIDGMEEHFGEFVELTRDQRKPIARYLLANAADQSKAALARRIMQSLGDKTPLRISETAPIRDVHQNLAPETLARRSLRSTSNCTACHPRAEQGVFAEVD